MWKFLYATLKFYAIANWDDTKMLHLFLCSVGQSLHHLGFYVYILTAVRLKRE